MNDCAKPPIPTHIDTLDDLITLLQSAKQKHGGHTKIRWTAESYNIGMSDDYRMIDDIVTSVNNSLLSPKGSLNEEYIVFVCE
jgi:hypothetical protein